MAVSVPETRIDAQADVAWAATFPQLLDHVSRSNVDVDVESDHLFQRFAIEKICAKYDRRWRAGGRKTSRLRPIDLSATDGVDHDAVPTDQVQYG